MKKFMNCFLIILLFSIIAISDINAIEKIESIKKVDITNVESNSSKKINPLWEKYSSLSEEEQEKWTVIPEKYIVEYVSPYNPLGVLSYGTFRLQKSTPSKYDLRSVGNKSYVTGTKNQGTLGLCWAFAANSSVESNILKSNLRTSDNPALFSERQLDYISAYPINNKTLTGNQNIKVYEEGYNPYSLGRDLGGGGNFAISAFYYGLGLSPTDMLGVWNSYKENYETVSLNDVFNFSNQSYVATDYVQFPYINNWTAREADKSSWREKIKNHIQAYGAVYVSTLAPQQYTSGSCYVDDSSDGIGLINWNTSCEEGYTSYPYRENAYHAMSIIGWDDEYSNSYCTYTNGYATAQVDKTTCEKNSGTYYTVNGAWILKNSWGKNNDYIYLAYDSYITETGGVVKSTNIDFDNTYNYFGPIYTVSYNNSNVMNVFLKSKTTEILKRISFETSYNSEVTYTVYLGSIMDVLDENLSVIGSVTTSMPGRYSIDIDDYYINDNNFVIKIVPSIDNTNAKASNIYAFTSNTTTEQTARTVFDTIPEYDENTGLYHYMIMTKTTNIDSGEIISYKIKNFDGIDLTSDFVNTNAYIVANAFSGSLKSTKKLDINKIYYIETYIGDKLLSVDAFSSGIPLEGSGTSVDPYLIKEVDDLHYMYTFEYSTKEFELNNNLDLSSINNFEPIGLKLNERFMGYFYGNDFTINGLNQNGEYGGLFYDLSGLVRDITFKNSNINSKKTAGILATIAYNAGIIGIRTEGKISTYTDTAYIGGIVGEAFGTLMALNVNRTSLYGGIEGSLVGYLGFGSYLEQSMNIGSLNGNSKSVSTFAGEIEGNYNYLVNLIDFSGREFEECYTNINDYSDIAEVENVYYYGAGSCTYLGNKLNDGGLRDAGNFSEFESTYWNIIDGKYPTLKDNPIIFTESIIPNPISDLFINDTVSISYTINPNNVTYQDYSYEIADESIATITDTGQITAHKVGTTTLTIKANDATRVSSTVQITVIDGALPFIDERIDGTFFIVKDENTKEMLLNSISHSGIIIETDNDEYIGTGDKLIYQYNGKNINEYTIVVNGDLSGDGYVGSNDILLLRRAILETYTLNPAQIRAGNFNGNGISSANALIMRRYILDLEGELK